MNWINNILYEESQDSQDGQLTIMTILATLKHIFMRNGTISPLVVPQ